MPPAWSQALRRRERTWSAVIFLFPAAVPRDCCGGIRGPVPAAVPGGKLSGSDHLVAQMSDDEALWMQYLGRAVHLVALSTVALAQIGHQAVDAAVVAAVIIGRF